MQTDDTDIHNLTKISLAMEKEEIHFRESDKKYAAVCGKEPSCNYAANHKNAIEKYLKNK